VAHFNSFDADSLRSQQADLDALRQRLRQKPPHHRRGGKFLKGPIPWPWLERAFLLTGKALHVALLLWREAGCRGNRTVRFCLRGELPEGLDRQAARRGLQQLTSAGLVEVHRDPGKGLEVTLMDLPAESAADEEVR
jgi:hypothetical protein